MNIIEVLRLPIGTKVMVKSNKTVTLSILKVVGHDNIKCLKFEKGGRASLDNEITEMEFELCEMIE